jgi:hypothetical protein
MRRQGNGENLEEQKYGTSHYQSLVTTSLFYALTQHDQVI